MILKKASPKKRAEQRILNIMAQLQAYEAGEVFAIACPYCGEVNAPHNSTFCCQMFAKASIAALERLRVEQSMAVVDRVMERHAKN